MNPNRKKQGKSGKKNPLKNTDFYIQNVSGSDALARYALSAALIMATMVFTSVADPWLVTFALIAVPIIASAIMLWDPICALFDVSTHQLTVEFASAGAKVVALHESNDGLNNASITDNKPILPSGGTMKAA